MRFPLCIAALVLACACNPGDPDPGDGDGEGVLTLRLTTPTAVQGSFRRALVRLDFEAERTAAGARLRITGHDGDELFSIEADHAGADVRMGGLPYLATGDRAGRVDAVAATATTETDQVCVAPEGAPEAQARFYAMPEVVLLPWLSAALGERGLNGRDAPATFLIHKLAMRVASDLGVEPPSAVAARAEATCDPAGGSAAVAAIAEPGAIADAGPATDGGAVTDAGVVDDPEGEDAGAEAPACADISGNPNGDNCYGMCGKGCSCWKWVCGDCCCNVGCRRHDAHCRACNPWRPWSWDCVQCACFDWGNPLFECTKCS